LLEKIEKTDANREADRKERKQEIRAGLELMASLVSWMDAHQERIMAFLGKMNAMDPKANPVEGSPMQCVRFAIRLPTRSDTPHVK
jgi:hypothetical protein